MGCHLFVAAEIHCQSHTRRVAELLKRMAGFRQASIACRFERHRRKNGGDLAGFGGFASALWIVPGALRENSQPLPHRDGFS
jgi:hypothetical protein